MRKILSVLIIFMLLLVLIPLFSSADIKDTYVAIGSSSNSQVLTRTSNGTLYTVYNDATETQIIYAVSYDNGSTWSENVLCDGGAALQRYPTIAVGSNDVIYIFWQGDPTGGGTEQVRFCYYDSSWSSIQNVTTGIDGGGSPAIAVDSNDLVNIVWLSASLVYYGWYCYANDTISSATVIDGVNNCDWPTIMIANDTIHIAYEVWQDEPLGNYSVGQILYIYKNNSGSWSGILNVTEVDYVHGCQYPSMIAINNTIHFIWTNLTYDEPGAVINVTYQYRNYSISWNNILNICYYDNIGLTLSRASCSISRDNNTLYAIFDGWDGADAPVIMYSIFNGTWSPSIIIKNLVNEGVPANPNPIYAEYPILFGNSTNIPCEGFAFIYTNWSVLFDSNITYYSNVTWNSGGLVDNPPIISNIQASPNPQLNNSYVNITCTVTDDTNLSTVKINVSGPAGFTTINVSMNQGGGNTFYYNDTYTILGTYTYFIWANDTTNHTTTSPSHTFDMVETLYTYLYVDADYDSGTPGWGVTHFNKISYAVENASSDYIILVNGDGDVYNENVLVDINEVTLIGNYTTTKPQVVGIDDSKSTITILADWINITGFNITNPLHASHSYHCIAIGKLGEDYYNVTINDCEIWNGTWGIMVKGGYNTIENCRIWSCDEGICIQGIIGDTYDVIKSNNISGCNPGIYVSYSEKSQIFNNTIYDGHTGIRFSTLSNNNYAYGNNITDNDIGIEVGWGITGNWVYHNNFISNSNHVTLVNDAMNHWNSSYSNGGNYWSGHGTQDIYFGVDQDLLGADLICDLTSRDPYVVGTNNSDQYPFLNQFNGTLPSDTLHPPYFTSESPANNSINISISLLTVNVTITATGTFNWTIGGSKVNTTSGILETTGEKHANLSNLSYSDVVTWWVNASNNEGYTNASYSFTIESNIPQFSGESPLNNSISIDISSATVNITITATGTFNWTIGGSKVNTTSGILETTGEKHANLSNLSYSDVVTWWVNASNNEGYTNASYSFTVETNLPQFSGESPANNSINISISLATVNVTITTAGTFNWTIGGNKVNLTTGTLETTGEKHANLSNLSYSDVVTWWVNASNNEGYTNASYSFTVETNLPQVSGVSPANNSININLSRATVNVTITATGTFNWTIGGSKVNTTSGISETTGEKHANLSNLSYSDVVTWWVNASNNEGYTNASYSFTIASLPIPIVYIDDDYDSGTPGWGVYCFANISDGINAVLNNGVVIIYSGFYMEHVNISKTVDIIGESKDTVIVDGNHSGIIFNITAENVSMTELKIQNGTDGIRLQNAHGFYIHRCLLEYNSVNYTGAGIHYYSTNDSIVKENNFTFYNLSILMDEPYCENNLIYHNNFFNCTAIDDWGFGMSSNRWNDSYPSGGNYWYDHWNPVDSFSGPSQDIPGSDGFIDVKYFVGRTGEDNYPFLNPIGFTNMPPSISNPYPISGATGISISQATVSIYISDASGSFDWSIEGKYIPHTNATGAGNGTKTASITTPLPYYTNIIWYVNATNGVNSVSAVYSFKTQKYSSPETNYVNKAYTSSDPQWRKTHWNYIQEAIDTVKDGGVVYIYSDTYNVGVGELDNLWINRSMTLQGEDRDTTIIHGEALHNGVVDHTIEVSTIKYPGSPINAVNNVTFKDLTIETEWIPFAQSSCIELRTAENVTIDNCTIKGDSSGGWNGIDINPASNNITISSCLIFNLTKQNGILSTGENVSIIENSISQCQQGIYIQTWGRQNNITKNIFYDNGWGLIVLNANYTNIIENDFTYNIQEGIVVQNGSNNTIIYHNNFYHNAFMHLPSDIQAKDDSLLSIWNDSYPSGGNYWDDFDEPSEGAYDRYSGPMQNITGHDGIVDGTSPNPYLLYGAGGAKDWYPLLYPYGTLRAYFIYVPKTPMSSQIVTFTDTSTGNIKSYSWTFGDGSTGSGKVVIHTYAKNGFYTVTLKITDVNGATSSYSRIITVGSGLVEIPPLQPPKYPNNPFTVPEMYALLRASVKGDAVTTIVMIDSGTTSRTYEGVDLSAVNMLFQQSYENGLDEFGHGTWISYCILYGIQTYCPKTIIYSIKTFDSQGRCTPEIFVRAIEMAKELHPDVVTISAGIFGSPDDVFSQAISDLRNAGIFVTVSAGNEGPSPSTVTSPACSADAMAIGAIDSMQIDGIKTILDLSDDEVCEFSSRGPVQGISPKPDFTAPGESIIGPWLDRTKVASGTSMAAPFIASSAIQIISSNKLVLDIVRILYGNKIYLDIIETSLADSAYDKGDQNSYGWGIPNVALAAQYAWLKAIYYIAMFIVALILFIVIILIFLRLMKKGKKKQRIIG